MARVVEKLKNNQQVRRFIVVGLTATVLDFALLFGLKALGLPTLGANIISTLVAFLFSFFANRHYTFQARGGDLRRQIISFTIVTLIGLWILQSIIIAAIEPSLLAIFSGAVATFLAKIVATVVSTIWNYLLYSRVVFTEKVTSDVK